MVTDPAAGTVPVQVRSGLAKVTVPAAVLVPVMTAAASLL
jgi:hypothetical protein